MKIGIILNTNDAETCWNCFRFGNEALKNNHSVKIFLLGKGVEVENVKDAKFPLFDGSIKKFLKNNYTCLRNLLENKIKGNRYVPCFCNERYAKDC